MIDTTPEQLQKAIHIYKERYPKEPLDIDKLEEIIKELK